MKLLSVLKHPNPTLTTPCSDVTDFGPELKGLIADMTYTMMLSRGVGLAANQVGVSKRIIVYAWDGKTEHLINPLITRRKGAVKSKEGCLSFPGVAAEVERSSEIWVSGQDSDGAIKRFRADGLLAVILQHEIDHLDGITFLDTHQIY